MLRWRRSSSPDARYFQRHRYLWDVGEPVSSACGGGTRAMRVPQATQQPGAKVLLAREIGCATRGQVGRQAGHLVHRDQHDDYVWMLRMEPFGDVYPIHSWHPDVQQNEVWLKCCYRDQPSGARV